MQLQRLVLCNKIRLTLFVSILNFIKYYFNIITNNIINQINTYIKYSFSFSNFFYLFNKFNILIMSVWSKIKNFFFRCCIYGIIILWPYTKLQNIYQDTDHFKTILERNFAFYGIRYDVKGSEDLILTIFFFYSLSEFIFCVLGIFNLRCGHIISIIHFIITNFLYFNPFLPENQILKLVNPKEELFFNLGVLLSLCVLTFKPEDVEKKEDKIEEKKPLNLEDDEMKKSMPVKKSKRK